MSNMTIKVHETKPSEAKNQYGQEILTKETIIKHLREFADAYLKVCGDLTDMTDEQLARDYEEKVYNSGDSEMDKLYDTSFAPLSFDELDILPWCDRVIELINERL